MSNSQPPSSGRVWSSIKEKVGRKSLIRRMSFKKPNKGTSKNRMSNYEDQCLLIFRAQVFTLSKNGDLYVWDKITDIATQLVLICEEDKPRHVYRVTTFDPELQGFIQGYIILPGTYLAKRSNNFVQWKDSEQGVIWGLFFAESNELEKFVELCVPNQEESPPTSNSMQSLLGVEVPSDLPTVNDQGNTSTNHSPTMVNGSKGGTNPSQTGLFSSLVLPDKKTESAAISGSVRKAIANRKDQRKLKYATYSGKNREALQKSYYDNIELEDGKCEDFDDSTLKASKSKPSRHGSHPELDIVGHQSASEHQDLVRQMSGSPRRGGYFSPSQIEGTLENGVLKSAQFVEANAQNFNTANSVALSSTPEKESKGDRRSGIRGRLMAEGQSFFGRGNKTKTKNKAKRSTSFSDKYFRRVHNKENNNKNSLDEAQRVLEETNTLLQAYEHQLQMQTLDESIHGLPSTGDNQSVASKSSGGTASDIPKWKKRLSEGIGSGSECSSVSFHGSTLTSSETTSKGDQDLQEFFFHDEDDLDDEEDGEEDGDSHSLSSHHTHASMFQQKGAIRKAGWLHVKSMLVQRKKRVERPGNRSWKKYWVCLKGTMLLFHAPSDRETDESSEPRHILVVENGLAQAVPEHPKRENIFCLSTAFGDSYFLQAPNQTDLENWTIAIHSACSSAFTRQHGKEETLRLLRLEAHKLEDKIELETKTKKMAELQMSTVSDPKNRQAIALQISQWDQNLESLQLELYRLKCYSSSLQATELPNPKTLLACVSKSTKATLSRLGYFNVSSFHALVCARNPMGLEGRFSKPKNKKQNGLFGTLKRNKKKLSAQLSLDKTKAPEESPQPAEEEVERAVDAPEPYAVSFSVEDGELESLESSTSEHSVECMAVKVALPDNQSSMITLKPDMTVQDLLTQCCMNRQMDVSNYYVRFKISLKAGANFIIPEKNAVLENEKFDEIEICAKSIHQIELCKFTDDMDFGFSVEAELMEDSEEEDQLCVFVSKVEKGALAYLHDLQVGDELLVINGRVVRNLDMLFIENLLQTTSAITLTIRSCRSVFDQTQAMVDTNSFINSMTCPPPPSQTRLTDDVIDNLIIPAPVSYDVTPTASQEGTPVKQSMEPKENNNVPAEKTGTSRESMDITALMKNAEKITELCRTYSSEDDRRLSSKINGVNSQELTEDQQAANKLRKVINELLDTERAYVKDIECLLSRYLEPLQEESFLSADEVDALFGNVKEIIKFQAVFLKCLEDASNVGGNIGQLSSPPEFKRVIFSIGGCFLYYMDHFKLYSSFCACHSRAQKILDPNRGNQALMEFLAARNPKQQHSASLASYLIKPIQRVLKYPLLLQEIHSNLDKDSTEQFHIGESLRGMESVAEHINDMMRVHEEFGDVFDSLVAEQYHIKEEVSDLAMDDLLYYSYVTWQNASEDVGKIKKGREPRVLLFVFRLAVVIIYKDAVRRKSRSAKIIGTNEETIKFKWMIPVATLQVKDTSISGSTEYQGMFELVHLRDEGKPEKIFQLICDSQDTRQTYIKTIRQVTRDFLKGKSTSGSNKYTYIRSKSYIAYGGKRLEALGKNKRTLRKNFGSSVSSGRSEASSLGSEERSSESGSLQDKSDLDSVSTGKESVERDDTEKLFYNRNVSVELNSNSNNSLERRLTKNNAGSTDEVFSEVADFKRPSLRGYIADRWQQSDIAVREQSERVEEGDEMQG